MSFELTEVTELKLKSVTFNKIFHGPDLVQAVYLNFVREGSNDILDLIKPRLREFHYFNAAATDGQETLPEHLAILPDLKVPELKQEHTFGGTNMYKGYALQLDYGLGGESNIDFTNAAAGKHEYVTKAGGTVVHEFQVSYWGESLTDEVVARLLKMERQKVFIKLLAPAVLLLQEKPKTKAPATTPDDGQQELDGDDADDTDPEDEDTPEKAAARAHGVTG